MKLLTRVSPSPSSSTCIITVFLFYCMYSYCCCTLAISMTDRIISRFNKRFLFVLLAWCPRRCNNNIDTTQMTIYISETSLCTSSSRRHNWGVIEWQATISMSRRALCRWGGGRLPPPLPPPTNLQTPRQMCLHIRSSKQLITVMGCRNVHRPMRLISSPDRISQRCHLVQFVCILTPICC